MITGVFLDDLDGDSPPLGSGVHQRGSLAPVMEEAPYGRVDEPLEETFEASPGGEPADHADALDMRQDRRQPIRVRQDRLGPRRLDLG
jgi:hypothetical protein